MVVKDNMGEDAEMLEVGDRGRSPGEPPDGSQTWAARITGGGRGGQPRPESVVDGAFVTERMVLEFPDGEEGEPVITIGAEVLEAMNSLWTNCIIVKVLGRHVALPALNRKLREVWKLQGGMSMVDLPRQFYMIRFEKEEEYLLALTGGPWRVFGSLLMVQAWSPEFDPSCDDIVTTPVWVRLANIPVNFYHETILLGIAKGLGKPVRVDALTLNCERARFARICVEVNLRKPLKGSVRINGVRYFVSYEGLSPICALCGVYGHQVAKCPKRPVEQPIEKSVGCAESNPSTTQLGPEGTEDGFTTVHRNNRRTRPTGKTGGVPVEATGENLDRNLREISNNTNMETAKIQNRFASLMENETSLDLMESVKDTEPDKENVSLVPTACTNKSDSPANVGMRFESGDTRGKKGDGPNDGRLNGSRGKTGPTKTQSTNFKKPNGSKKPTMGLVFGPKRRDVELSSSGKRLRVEAVPSGRDGGAFAISSEQNLKMIVHGSEEEGNNLIQLDSSNQKNGDVSHTLSLGIVEGETLA